MKKGILDLLYPEKCIVCHRVMEPSEGAGLCVDCRSLLLPVEEPRCKRCSKALADMETEMCEDCRDRKFYVERGFALYPYNGPMRRAIRNFKYSGELAGGIYFAEQMAERYGNWVRSLSPDVLIPVPIHKKRMRFRGFNQAACLAEGIGRRLGIPVEQNGLIRTENTKPQKGLDSRSRLNNLKKGFAVSQKGGGYRCAVLVDDIYTTGATLEACGKALREAGTKSIYFLCLCIGRGD